MVLCRYSNTDPQRKYKIIFIGGPLWLKICLIWQRTTSLIWQNLVKLATILRGKNKPEFTPNVDCGDFVIVINCNKVRLTGKKLEQKYYRHHTGYIGGLKEVQYKKIMQEKPEFAVYKAVKGMLPKNSLGEAMLTKLRVYAGSEHPHSAQQPVELKLN